MAWIGSNWIWIALVIGMGAMHLFGHGGHRHGSRRRDDQDDGAAGGEAMPTRPSHERNSTAQLASRFGDGGAVPAPTPAKHDEHG